MFENVFHFLFDDVKRRNGKVIEERVDKFQNYIIKVSFQNFKTISQIDCIEGDNYAVKYQSI